MSRFALPGGFGAGGRGNRGERFSHVCTLRISFNGYGSEIRAGDDQGSSGRFLKHQPVAILSPLLRPIRGNWFRRKPRPGDLWVV